MAILRSWVEAAVVCGDMVEIVRWEPVDGSQIEVVRESVVLELSMSNRGAPLRQQTGWSPHSR